MTIALLGPACVQSWGRARCTLVEGEHTTSCAIIHCTRDTLQSNTETFLLLQQQNDIIILTHSWKQGLSNELSWSHGSCVLNLRFRLNLLSAANPPPLEK